MGTKKAGRSREPAFLFSVGNTYVAVTALNLSIHQRLLQLRDMPCDIDLLRASLDAIENCVAAPNAVLRIDDVEPLVGSFVPRIEREPVGFQK